MWIWEVGDSLGPCVAGKGRGLRGEGKADLTLRPGLTVKEQGLSWDGGLVSCAGRGLP